MCALAARRLADALAKKTPAGTRFHLAFGLVAVARRLEPADAAKLLAETLAGETDTTARLQLTGGLAAFAARLGPVDAAEAARHLAHALAKETVASVRKILAARLAEVVDGIPVEVALAILMTVEIAADDAEASEQLAGSAARACFRLTDRAAVAGPAALAAWANQHRFRSWPDFRTWVAKNRPDLVPKWPASIRPG